jgi:hypothetical protein
MTMPDRHRMSVVPGLVRGDALVATGWTGCRKERPPMHAITALVVNEHLEYLRAEAAERNAARGPQPSLLDRVASAASRVRTAVTTPANGQNALVPSLDDYPYRS